jgi:hypothetical protein
MPLQEIGRMSLKCSGGFVAKIQFVYVGDDGKKKTTGKSGDITLGRTKTVDPGSLGVPDGKVVYLKAFVKWGKDKEAKQPFQYRSGDPATADYVISGTTLSNDLAFKGIS